MSIIIGLIVASFMLYFPYEWCRLRGESERDYGLKWFLTRESKRDVIIALAVTLIPLTVITFYWPYEWGGRGLKHPSLWTALDQLGGGIAAAFIIAAGCKLFLLAKSGYMQGYSLLLWLLL